jgi:hypothetical protein
MNQSLYAHMNNKRKMKKKNINKRFNKEHLDFSWSIEMTGNKEARVLVQLGGTQAWASGHHDYE